MIYSILGTKGQFIKMFPVMKRLDEEHIPYQFVSTSQHFSFIQENSALFGMRKPDIYLSTKTADLRNIQDVLTWATGVLWNGRTLNIHKTDTIVTHGDTESTLLVFLLAKYFGARLVHVESGLRSGSIVQPFPEEIIRYIVDHNSDVCFCPYQLDADHVPNNKEIFVTRGNTVFDAVKLAVNKKPSSRIKNFLESPHVVFLVHRKETLFLPFRLQKALEILEMILQTGVIVLWPVHANTKHALESQSQWKRIVDLSLRYNLILSDFFNYVDFVHLLKTSVFAATDGDGVQEETYVLNKPALILRNRTDSLPGIGETACVSSLDPPKAKYFLDHLGRFKRTSKLTGSPSEIIVEYLKRLAYGNKKA